MVVVTTEDAEYPARARPPIRRAALCVLPDDRVDVHAASRELVAGVGREPWGQLSPSVYETGRLVTLAPWLSGHARRIGFLVATQRRDGSWHGPDGYALVPTLSGAEALLTAMHGRNGGNNPIGIGAEPTPAQLSEAVNRALSAVFDQLRAATSVPIPDTPAVEIIVPGLVAAVNKHLDRLSDSARPGLDAWQGTARLHLPTAVNGQVLAAIEASLAVGEPVAAKLMHSLEVAGPYARNAPGVQPVPPGTVGASPAATAAWLGNHEPEVANHPAVGYLEEVVRTYGGPVPSVVPITIFERAWVLSTLATAGLHPPVSEEFVASLRAAIGTTGTPGGAGLPPDADTTSVALLALGRLGVGQPLDCLWAFETETHFVTWRGERTSSTTTNAHVLDALTGGLATDVDALRARAAAEKIGRWLRDQQQPDGTWTDKWHASAYYATACCTLALHRLGDGASSAAIGKATAWVLGTQRADGSWGRWSGTAEETAYAVQILLLTVAPGPERDQAAARGYAYLRAAADEADRPPLWHDKDLYSPLAVVQAAIIAALHLAQGDPSVMSLAARR